jgi:Sulfotransferase domain
MMRSFGNRPDCRAVDEPFYAYYLSRTGFQHPMREAVIASQPTRWQAVVSDLEETAAQYNELLYIKHMTHHILPEVDVSSFLSHKNCFLIRDPRLVIASYAAKWNKISTDDIGIKRQVEIFDEIRKLSGQVPIVVEAEDILKDPEPMLRKLCSLLGISWQPEMLNWPSGRRAEDGVWAEHWYASVDDSTGFAPYVSREVDLTSDLEVLATAQMPYYEELRSHKITT